MTSGKTPSRIHIQAALDWYYTLEGCSEDASEHPEFQAWLKANEQHQTAWNRITYLNSQWRGVANSETLSVINSVEQLKAHQDIYQASKTYLAGPIKRHAKKILVWCCLVSSLIYAQQNQWGQWLTADYRNGIGEPLTITLDDHSQLTLASGTAVDIKYTDEVRRIVVKKGMVLSSVARQPHRPFIVETSYGTAKALGTIYSVQLQKDHMVVNVIESSVQVCPQDNLANQCQALNAGNKAKINKSLVYDVEKQTDAYPLAWLDQQIVVDDILLSDLLAQLNKHHFGFIHYSEKDFADLHISGIFPLNDPIEALNRIQAALPIQYHTFTNKLIHVRKNN